MINISFDTGYLGREEAAGLIALLNAIQPVLRPTAELMVQRDTLYGSTALTPVAEPAPQPPIDNDHVADGASPFTSQEVSANTQARVPGQPSPGKARRTKAEIAEDEALEKGQAGNGNISTGGERADPENPDDAATEAQDKADEQAEVDEHRDADAPLTVDDVKAVVGGYVEKYGMPAAQEDGVKIFVEALGAPPAGNDYWKMSILPYDDQAKIAKVIATWNKAIELNPLKRAAV